MSGRSPEVDILIVDDEPEKLLALEVALEPLGENVVPASSGLDALSEIPGRELAVILLDIDMPITDGFETAELIRRHRGSKHTPIIFMTAARDDLLIARSYALGAVDCIPTPVEPDVLRSKVRVFVDLFRKTREAEEHAAALAEQAARLRRLADASLAITSKRSLDAILQSIADAARDVARAHQATTTMDLPSGHVRGAASLSERYSAYGGYRPGGGSAAVYALACPRGGPLRLTQREMEARPALAAAVSASGGPPPRGLLAVPLLARDGCARGLIQVSDPQEGDFTEDDEASLMQVSQLGSIAIQNCLHAEAWEANRLEDEFLSTLSHELRTPLTALLGWTRLLRAGPLDPARVGRALEVIERNVNVQKGLIEELLDVSRITAGKLRVEVRPLSLAPVVEGAVDALRHAAGAKGITLRAALEGDGARVLGDPERLRQVASNIVGNAIKFTPKGGSVDVSVRREGEEVLLVVADTGEGMAPEFLPFVFDRFRQADGATSGARTGLGLGLSVVRHLVEVHGGSVRAESDGIGRGSTFVVRLPELVEPVAVRALAPTAPARSDAPPAEPAPVSGMTSVAGPESGVRTLDGIRVLVVEDNDDARELLKEVLSQHRAHVTTASSASEALDALDAFAPDVLVSDVAMTGGDGYELIQNVRRRAVGSAIPALALTAYARSEDRARALAAGFQMHAAKPIEPHTLVDAVATLAGSRGRGEGDG